MFSVMSVFSNIYHFFVEKRIKLFSLWKYNILCHHRVQSPCLLLLSDCCSAPICQLLPIAPSPTFKYPKKISFIPCYMDLG